MRYKNVGASFFHLVTIDVFDRRTEERTDISLVAKTACIVAAW